MDPRIDRDEVCLGFAVAPLTHARNIFCTWVIGFETGLKASLPVAGGADGLGGDSGV
jgi:hypothetical protein